MPYKYLLLGFLLFFSSNSNQQDTPSTEKLAYIWKPNKIALNENKPFWETQNKKDNSVDTDALKQSNWYAEVMKGIEESEYEVKYDTKTKSYASPNRKNNLRSFYTASKFSLLPRNDSAEKWKLDLSLLGIYSGKQKLYSPVENAVVTQSGKIIQFNNDDNFITEYVNTKEGVRQNFIINKEPVNKPKQLAVKLAASKNWFVNKVSSKEIHFAKATKTGYDKKITYNSLKVWDADNKELDARFEVVKNEISIQVNTAKAAYPITIDPISTGIAGTVDWIGDDANQTGAIFGTSVASAGDVNGDGYSDVIIGAPRYDVAGRIDEGSAFIYHGSATGLSSTPNSSPNSINQANAFFGNSVASAGDVNGDGYSDVIIGSYLYDEAPFTNEGRAFVYHGSASGLVTAPASMPDDCDQAGARFGTSVASAGDVNGDGYSDVIIGASYFNDGVNTREGRAYVYYGSAAGISASPDSILDDGNQAQIEFGNSVASAGDINGDGYSDVVIGAWLWDEIPSFTNDGKLFVYHGSAAGLSASPNTILDGPNENNANLGISVACAGDVNGDGYSDIIAGATGLDYSGRFDEGAAFIYFGSAGGAASTPSISLRDANQAYASFGESVASAGDLNGDGYSDVIIGANQYDDTQTNEGVAFIYYGKATGLSASPVAILDDANQTEAAFGSCVASAGDVNGDGFSDVIIGAYFFTDGAYTNEGRAFVYHGSASGISNTASALVESNQISALMGISVASAGDVNADGYSDVIVGTTQYDGGQTDEGAAFIYHGSATGISSIAAVRLESDITGALMGSSVASAGDVNGDGYCDVIAGANGYTNSEAAEGAAFLYHGSAIGINAVAASLVESNQAAAQMGISVASAGDVNADGYSDVIVGAYLYDSGQNNEGVAFVYHGSASGINTTAAANLESNLVNAQLGISVASAGDINGDGYSDVIAGADGYTNGETTEGAFFVYHGSAIGINGTAAAIVESNQTSARLGFSVASAGDVNGDGYSDVIAGAYNYNNGQASEGAAFIYQGTATGISTAATALLECNQIGANLGISVASAGDVNGDGYSDVIVGAYLYDNGQNNEGAAFVYHGSATGISTTAAMIVESNQISARMGYSVAGAGDINGDGYSDVIVGAPYYDNGHNDEGAAFVYHGNAGGGLQNNLRLYNQDLITPIQRLNITEPNLFGAGLYAKSPLGRVKGKLVWEVKGQGSAFSGNPITNSSAFLGKQPSFTDLNLAGIELKYNVQKVGKRNNKIRTRVEYDKVTAITGQMYGPWRYQPGYTQGAHGMNSVPLPITLISFNGQFVHADDVQLKWITTNETDMKTFYVERSTDGINFTTVGELPATGLGSNRTDYDLTDKNVQQNLLYYRLKLKDKAGEISYTKTITLSRSKIIKGFIAPNPVLRGNDAVLVLQATVDKTAVSISIYNTAGQLVFTENKILQRGENKITVSTNKLGKGVYSLLVLGDKLKERYGLAVQ